MPDALTGTMTTSRVFLAFVAEAERARAWLRSRVRGALGYAPDTIADRLAQRVAETGILAYAPMVKARLDAGQDPLPPPGTPIEAAGLRLTTGSGVVTVPPAELARQAGTFLMHWAYCLAAIAAGALRGGRRAPSVLLYDMSAGDLFVDGDDAAFVAFCRRGPLTPLAGAERVYVATEVDAISSEPGAFVYTRHPHVALVREARLGAAARARLFVRHLALLVRMPMAVVSLTPMALLAKEAAYVEAVRALDGAGLIAAVVHTCSSYRYQPLWSRELRGRASHMVWYAQNWKPLARADGDADAPYPWLPWIRADVHWVWTERFAAYLRTLIPGAETRAVGPILWRLPAPVARSSSAIDVLVFDVPAVSDHVMLHLNGELTNYFRPELLRAFLDQTAALTGALESRTGRPVRLRLKMKRGFRPDYAREYYDFVDAAAAAGRLELADAQQNLYGLIASSDLVISYPFTSPCYIAEAAGVPSIYFDASGTLAPHQFGDTGTIRFAGSQGALLAEATAALGAPAAVRRAL